MKLVAFSLTSVKYVEGDPVGFLLALFTLSPIFIVVMYASIIVSRRDIQTVFSFIGQLIGVVVNLILKKLIAAPRPEHSDFEDEGMPSNHAQFISFYCTLQILKFLFHTSPLSQCYRITYSFALILLGALVSISRVYLHYHTIDQVVVGVIVGSILAAAWFRFENIALSPIAHLICKHKLAIYLRVRNYDSVKYAPMQEYDIYCAHKKSQ